MREWRHQASEWNNFLWGSCWDLLEWDLGHCVWWVLVRIWCTSGLQTAWLCGRWYGTHNYNIITELLVCAKFKLACPSVNWNSWCTPHAALMVVFMNYLYRGNSTLQCLLWSGDWSHSSRWLDLHKHWISTSGLPTWWNWSVWLLQGPSRWCWTPMCRKWVIHLQTYFINGSLMLNDCIYTVQHI